MASIKKRGASWRALVKKGDTRDSQTFPTKSEATAWAARRQSEIELGIVNSTTKTLRDALEKYRDEESPKKRGARWEQLRLNMFARIIEFSDMPLKNLRSAHLAEWRNDRLKEVSPATVRREMVLLRSVLELARREWGWINVNPIQDVKKPSPPPHRERLISLAERDALVEALGYVPGTVPLIAKHRVAMAFLLALETGMRTGELYGLTWDRVFLDQRFVRLQHEVVTNVAGRDGLLPTTKNGESRDVPLSRRAVEILELLPRTGETCFDVKSTLSDVLFRKAKDLVGVKNLHFHDSRATALTALAKKLNVLDLARMIGHRDIKSLQIYYRESATSIASRLD